MSRGVSNPAPSSRSARPNAPAFGKRPGRAFGEVRSARLRRRPRARGSHRVGRRRNLSGPSLANSRCFRGRSCGCAWRSPPRRSGRAGPLVGCFDRGRIPLSPGSRGDLQRFNLTHLSALAAVALVVLPGRAARAASDRQAARSAPGKTCHPGDDNEEETASQAGPVAEATAGEELVGRVVTAGRLYVGAN